MKNLFLLVAIMFTTGMLFAQAYEGPYPEITNGYGAFGNHPIAEKKFDNTFLLNHEMNHGDGGVEITMRYPSDVQGPVPTVLFASGWNQYDPAIFDKLLDFIASNGYCVVFTPYPTDQSNGHTWEASLYEGMKQAIDENSGVNAGDLNIIDKTRIGFFGHSLGAGDIYWLGYKFYVDHGYGSNGKFLFSVAGWHGFNMTEEYLANYPSDCKLRVEIWEEDDHDPANDPPGNTSPRIQYYLFHQINIPDTEKCYVKVFGGADNAPGNNGYHYSTHHDLVTMNQYNALDFYAIFRPLHAMMDWVFNGDDGAKWVALALDKGMGPFPDLDTDYNTFVFMYDESTYDYPCDVPGNPFHEHCPDAPLAVDILEPLTARVDGHQVLLSWTTATETNSKGFDIQRSTDGVSWESVGWIDGQGSSTQSKRYEALDNAPKNGVNFYRYEQIDYDGQATFSNIVSVDLRGEANIQLAPNPAQNEVTIYTHSNDLIERVEIRSLAGKIVQVANHPGHSLDVSALPQGIYQVAVQLQSGVGVQMLVVE